VRRVEFRHGQVDRGAGGGSWTAVAVEPGMTSTQKETLQGKTMYFHDVLFFPG